MTGQPWRWKYPWHLDQFFVPGARQGDMRRCYKMHIRYHGGAYRARTVVQDGVKGVLVCRVA